MKRMMKRLAALIAVFLMGLGCIAPAQTAYAANFITFNQTIQDSYGVKTSIFQVDNTYAFCCEAMKPTPYRDMQVYISESTDPELLKVLWYGTKGPGAVLVDNNDGYMKTSQAASLALGNGRVHSRYETWYKEVITYAAPPSGFKAYIATPVNSTYQALAFSVYYPEGSAYLTKSSSDASFSGGSGYSLANAVYGVYTDSVCSSEVATFTTGSNGVSNTITLDAGTYYVKEKSAPQGFELDTSVHTLVVESGSTKNLTVTDTPKGRLKLLKQSSDAGFSSGSEYSLAGAEYSVYTESACTSAVGSFTTDAYGNTGEIILSQGTYYVKETKAPQGFELDTTIYPVTVTAATMQTLTVTDVPKGKLTLIKESTDANVSTGNQYSLQGAEYVVYSDPACTNAVGSFVTDSRGMTDEIMLGAGTYYVKETKAPMGFELDTAVHSASVVAGQVNTFRAKDVPLQGKLSFLKKSSNPEITDGNSCYSLAGAKFGVYKDAAKTQLVGTLITNANGKTTDLTLPLGKYYVKELEAPKGFALCEDFTVEVVVEGVVKEVENNPQDDPVAMLLQKVDATTGKPVAVGGANLAGAEYTFKYYAGIYDKDPSEEGKTPLRSWVFKTNNNGVISFDENLKVSGDDFYYNAYGIPTLPLGTLTIQETKAPEGYKLNPEVYVRTITAEGTSESVNTYNEPITPETVQRGDVEFVKIDAKTQKRMANVKFRLTETTTGESHILITDENGKASTASSWNKHSNHTNRGERSSDGIWFGLDSEGNMAPVDDNVGALPYGTYKLEELQCDANKGYDLFDHIIFKIDSDEKVVNLGSLENHFVELDTVALDKITNSHHSHANGEVTIVDTVYYEGLTAGKTYKLTSKVIDTATGQVLNVNGKDIALEKEFSPTISKSFEQTSFTFDAKALAGKTIVVTQELYREGILISSHINLSDEDQMVRFPKIGTSAVNGKTNSKLADAGKEIIIEDKVSFENVIPNKHYVLKGKLMNADTGESIKVNGKEVVVEQDFRTRTSNGTETVKFVLNDPKLAGYTITVFEVLCDEEGAIIASHEVLNDSAQTIYIPQIGTSATSSVTKEHVMDADKNAVIVDKVEYIGLMPGEEYTVSGVLMNKETGKALIVDGRQVTANKKFTAADKNGIVEIKFEFDASELAGTTVVVFEDLYYGLTIVASHKDIEDVDQTVYIPEISTSAVESTFDNHVAIPAEKAVITDTVTYTNLLPGKEYKVDGVLMDKDTGKALLVNGKEVTATKTFTAAKAEGTVELVFEFDSSALAGKVLVVFESLSFNGTEIAVHEDLSDAEQSIYYPSIGTSAVEGSFNTHVALVKKEAVITDTVSYENLPVGETFKVEGILMDKATGKALLVDGKEVTASKEFIATKNSGSVELEFTFDATGLEGTTVVVFETLLYGNVEIAVHKDITDAEQSIYYPSIGTAAIEGSLKDQVAIPKKDAVITDTVSYTNLPVGETFKVKGIIMDKATGKELLVDGKKITAEKEFTTTSENGSVEIKFELDAEKLEGSTIVVFEELSYKNVVIAVHKDINDEGQTIYYPSISTSAVESTFDKQVAVPATDTVITDTVTYTNLMPGKEYTVKGVLMNKETGKPLLVNGKEITSEKKFTAASADGTVELTFTFDSSVLKGTTVVVFESLYYKGTEVTVHKDIEDSKQSIYYPSIGTMAVEGSLDDHVAIPKKNAVITDMVSYTNLPVGEKFTLSGILMDKTTEQPLLVDGKEVTASISFRTTKSNGSEKLKFEFDSSAIEGKTIVVYETLIYDGEEVTMHKDINDEGQTIYYPSIGTSAVEGTFDKHVAVPTEKTVVTDTVTYTNLMPGKEYTVKGVLMNKETGKPLIVDGKNVTAEKKFVPTSTNGSVELEFTFNSSALKGTTVVVFEALYYKNTEITVHKDISDAEQSIYYPSIGTMAVENSFNDHMALSKKDAVITDTVSYTDIPVGETFKVRGTLMDKATGKALLVGGKEVTAKKEFKAVKESGTIEMKFEFDSSALEGITVVVFEELLYENTVVTVHKDISDAEQSIYYPSIGTTAIEGSFNDHVAIPAKDAKITDTVAFKDMPVGAELTVKGVLMDKSTGKALLVDGKEVTASKTFTTKANEGTVELEFKFDASVIEGTTVVVFEEVVYKNTVVAEHKELTDEGQTVHFPKIRTKANEDSFAIGNLAVPNETMTIKDKVSFTNLLPSKEYTVSGVLMNKETGKPLLVNDKEIRAEKTFTAAATEGFVELEFEFDASELAGTTIVVFEELLFNNTVVVTHKDLEDAAQTIFIPAIHTNAIDKDSEVHKTIVGEENVIIDTVTYESLVSGEEYTVKGYLVDKATKEPIMADGKKIESEVTFKAEANDGEEKLDFVIPGNVAGGKEIVVFEELYYEDTLIASHKDIDDENQTVKYDYTSVIVNKIDMKTEKALAGAKLQLIELVKDEELSTEGNAVYEEIVVEEWITDGNPYECKNIKNGLYLIREVETPDGYVTCKELTFEKVNAYDELEFNVKDDIIKLEISKKDAVDKSEIKGAKMQILNADGKVVEEWTTDGKTHCVEYLPVGSYTLVEKEAPFGYILSEPIEFEVKDTAEVQVLEMLDARTQGYIKIEKLSSVNRKALAGAEFEFRNKDGEVIETLITDENGNVQSKSVDIGIYENGEFKEFAVYYLQETVAPEGYQLDDTVYEIEFGYLGDDVPVVYKHYKIPNIKVVLEEPEPEWELIPTGDNTQYLTYFALMAAAFATMLVVLKKRTNKEI